MIATLIPVIGTVIDKIFPDKEAAAKAKLEMIRLEQEGAFKDIDVRGKIVEAEANSEHWLTAGWRPITALVFVFIVANNYILAPYIDLFFARDVFLEIPDQLWNLLNIMIGGYVVSRGGEKIVKELMHKNG